MPAVSVHLVEHAHRNLMGKKKLTSVKTIVREKSNRLKPRAKKSLENAIKSTWLLLIDLGCILSLCPNMTLKKRKRKFGVMERIESQLFQKV